MTELRIVLRSAFPMFWVLLLARACAAQLLALPATTSQPPTPGLSALERVNYALELAQIGAENDMQELSLTAVRRALGNGPPIELPGMSGPFASAGLTSFSTSPMPATGADQVQRSIEERLRVLSALWLQHEFPPGDVYDVLQSVVFPESRPGEIFLYSRPVLMRPLDRNVVVYSQVTASSEPLATGSVGQLLTEWAVRAHRQDELRSRLAGLAEDPRTQMAAEVLIGHLAMQEQDEEGATECLQRLDRLLQQNSSNYAAEQASLLALPALDNPATRGAALPLIDRLVTNVTPTNSNEGTNIAALSSLARLASRMHFALGDIESGRRMLETFLKVHEVANQQYGGDYPVYLRKMQLGVVAFELLRAGDVDEGLKRLTERADLVVSRDYGTVSDAGLGALLARKLAAMPPEERYRVLSDFTLPKGNRKALRLVMEFVPRDAPPDVFATTDEMNGEHRSLRIPAQGIGEDLFSTGFLLVDAAAAVGKLDELLAALDPLAEAKVEGARELVALARLRQGNRAAADAELARHFEELKGIADQNAGGDRAYPLQSHLFAAETARDPALARASVNVLDQLLRLSKQSYNDPVRSHIRWALALTAAALRPEGSRDVLENAAPAAWTAAAYETGAEHAAGSAPNLWLAQDGMINHLCGPHDANLFFRYPLTGNFEFACDAQDGDWGEGNLGYGGVMVEFWGYGNTSLAYGDGRHGATGRQPAPFARAGQFNRLSVRVQDDVVTFLVNGHPAYRDRTGDNPWLALHADWGRNPVFGNLRLTGTPVIPREVSLSEDPRLRGWISSFYGETRPDPLAGMTTAGGQPVSSAQDQSPPGLYATVISGRVVTSAMGGNTSASSQEFDWQQSNGEIVGRRSSAGAGGPLQSRLYYHRPLLDGERMRYEFYYVPESVEVHPAIGRLAFLLEPDGVELHWMTDGEAEAAGLAPDNRVVVAGERRGPARLPLTPSDWNQVEVARTADVLTISVNSVAVYEHPLDTEHDALFGFFHDRDATEARVRNVVLSGDWPERVPEEWLADLAAPADPDRSPADTRTVGQVINETFPAQDALGVYQQAMRMPVAQRYDFLHGWVLPGPSHADLRIYAAATPTHPSPLTINANPVDVSQLAAARAVQPRRIEIGGNLVSPAQELVHAAAELGRLDELLDEVDAIAPETQFQARARLGLLALIRMAQDRAAEAEPYLVELYALCPTISDFAVRYRWVDVIAASAGIEHPETRDVAIELANLIVTQQLQNGKPGEGAFDSQVRRVRSLGWLLRQGTPRAEIGRLNLTQWSPAVHSQAAQRGNGYSTSHWTGLPGELRHSLAHETDGVYFAVPLRGNYEINARLSSFGWRETRISAAGLWTGIIYTRDKYDLGHARSLRPTHTLDPPLEFVGAWYDYRIEVKEGAYTSFVDGHKLHQEALPESPDPWVEVVPMANTFGGVRQLVITGEPTIPEEIDLLSVPDLSNWVYDYYGESAGGEDSDWKLEGGVLIGRHKTEWAGMLAESVIRYHRPLLEDGEVRYEFFYTPEKVLAHPALDRLALLVTPEGIREHWLTDAQWDRTGVAPDNIADVAEHRRGPAQLPLKPEEWNQAVLSIAGDALTLSLNGEVVYERPIEPDNLRTFGLFHYGDQTEVRVRGIVHRGAWPRALPSPEQQELAPNPIDVESGQQIQMAAEFDLTAASIDDSGLAFDPKMKERFFVSGANGMTMNFTPGEQKPVAVYTGPKFGLHGDFDIIAEFAGLQITPPAEHWGAGIELNVDFQDRRNSRIQFERRFTKEGAQNLGGAYFSKWCDGSGRYHKETYPLAPEAGRLRVSRRGGMLYYSFAKPGSADFTILDAEWVGADDARGCSIRAVSSDSVGGVEVTWKSLAVTAEQFIPSPRAPQPVVSNWKPDLVREPIGGPHLKAVEAGAEKFVYRTAAGVRAHTPSDPSQGFGVTLGAANVRIEGDFDVTADFELAELSAPESGYGSGIQLRLELDDPLTRVLQICRRAFPDGTGGFAVHNVWQQDGERKDEGAIVPSEAMSGRLRTSRRGSTVTWSFASAGSDEFQEVYSAEAGTAPVKLVALVCESSDPASGSAESLWKSLEVNATTIRLNP